MEWLLFWFQLEVGCTLFGDTMVNTEIQVKQYYTNQPYYIEFQSEFELFEIIKIYGLARIDMYTNKSDASYWPVNLTSLVGIEANIDKFTFGYRHECGHAVVPWQYDSFVLQNMDSVYDQVYFRFSTKE